VFSVYLLHELGCCFAAHLAWEAAHLAEMAADEMEAVPDAGMAQSAAGGSCCKNALRLRFLSRHAKQNTKKERGRWLAAFARPCLTHSQIQKQTSIRNQTELSQIKQNNCEFIIFFKLL
jgi:hypothetical protein